MQTKEIKLTPRKFEDLSSLKYSMFTCPLITWPDGGMQCLVIQFRGECGKSTENNGSGYELFMSTIIKAAMTAWQPVALVLDLRQLKYVWGDEMSIPFHTHRTFEPRELLMGSIFGEYPKLVKGDLEELDKIAKDELALPMAAVVSELNRTGLTSLVKEELSRDFGKEMNPEDILFETLEDALASVDQRLQKIFQKL